MVRNIIWDFSGSCSEEGLCEVVHGDVIDCRGIEGTNCYCEDEAYGKLTSMVPEMPEGLVVNWIDTGDYHYMSRLTVARNGRLTLVVLDHHPDMQKPAFGGILSCGGWVRSLLEDCPQIGKVVILGINPDLVGECDGFGDIVTVYDENHFMDFDPSSLTGQKVYLSIDKDVLTHEYARTDWDQGTMDMEYLENLVRDINRSSEIVGIDVCGGITSGKGGSAEDFAINRGTDKRLSTLFESLGCN